MNWSLRAGAPSLRLRLLGGMAAVALIFLTTAGVVLDRAFQASAARAAAEKLDVYLLALVGIAEVTGDRVDVPTALLDVRFARPASGLYGLIVDGRGGIRWRSASTASKALTPGLGQLAHVRAAKPGVTTRDELDLPGYRHVFRSAMTVVFAGTGGADAKFTFVAVLSRDAVVAEVGGFRNTLWVGLGLVGVVLMLAELLLFRAITAPLTRLARAVEAVERGESEAFGSGWPVEVAGVTSNLDRLIVQERNLRERYRTLTDDLAHTLKTPLAVLRNGLDEIEHAHSREYATDNGDERVTRGRPSLDATYELLHEQVTRMQQVLDERLNRVVVQPTFARPLIPAQSELESLIEALRKLYPTLHIALTVRGVLRFPGEARDLIELAGNLIDNACKYGRGRIVVDAAEGSGNFLLIVADDGPGIAESMHQTILQRGVRADTRASGQGIGLAVVRELVDAYQGSIDIGTSAALGGAEFTLRIPLTPPRQPK